MTLNGIHSFVRCGICEVLLQHAGGGGACWTLTTEKVIFFPSSSEVFLPSQLEGRKDGQYRASTTAARTSQQQLADSMTNEAMNAIQCHYLIGCNLICDFM